MSKAAITNIAGKTTQLDAQEYRRLMALARIGYYHRRNASLVDDRLSRLINERVE